MSSEGALRRERRIATRMLARGEQGLADTLLLLKGVVFGRRYRFESLLAVGGEGAVYLVRDLEGPARASLVGKIALHPVHRPFDLTSDTVRERRRTMRLEAVLLETNGSEWMPRSVGTFQCLNGSLPARRGGAFVEAEPVLMMERLPGLDLDRWLARAHDRGIDPDVMRPVVDQIAKDLIAAVADLRAKGFHYADLRPGNIRIVRRPERRIRLLDAGSLVRTVGDPGRFPHVPAYLPPNEFQAALRGEAIEPNDQIVAVMAGRTLFEIATGERAFPGRPVDASKLAFAPVSPGIAELIRGLCEGSYRDIESAACTLEIMTGSPRATAPASVGLPMPTRSARVVRTLESIEQENAAAAQAVPAAVQAPSAAPWELPSFLAEDAAGLPDASVATAPPRRTSVAASVRRSTRTATAAAAQTSVAQTSVALPVPSHAPRVRVPLTTRAAPRRARAPRATDDVLPQRKPRGWRRIWARVLGFVGRR